MIRRFLSASAMLVVWLAILCAPGIVRAQTLPQDPVPVPSRSPSPVPVPSPGTDPGPSSLTSEYWATAPGEHLLYEVARLATTFVWTFNKLLFIVADTLAQFRLALIGMFGEILTLTVVGRSLLPLVRPAMVLAATLAVVLYLFPQLIRVDIVSIRRILVLAMFLPPALTAGMGAVYGWVEDARVRLAEQVGQTVFDTATVQLGGGAPDLPIYDPAAPNRLADVAASVVSARKADIDAPEDRLPPAFEAQYYTEAPTDWSSLGADARQAYLQQGWLGFNRMAFATAAVSLLVLDAVLQTLWALTLALLCVAFTIVVCFAVWGPFAKQATHLASTIAMLVLSAMAIAAVQGGLVGYLVYLADSGTPLAVIAMAAFVFAVYVVFIGVALFFGIRGLWATTSAPVLGADAGVRRGVQMATALSSGGLLGTIGTVNAIDPTSGRRKGQVDG